MISKTLSTTHEKNMVRKTSHIKLITAITTFGLLVSQSVYAADEASSGGIPVWVWLLLVVAILVGITLLPKKWIDPKKTQTPQKKGLTPTPAAPAKAVVTARKIEKPPTIKAETPAPVVVVDVAPVAVKEAPKPEKIVEVADALDEAKQLLAQQRFPQAVGVLNKGLQKNPERSDLMLELLAIYLKQSDHEAFDAQFEQLKQLDDPLALIQAEELHDQLERPTIVEDSDHIEFDLSQAKTTLAEPTTPTEVADYTADSLDFTLEKPHLTDAESTPLAKTVEMTPIETEFSLDDIDLGETSLETKATPVEVAAKKQTDDFDFSAFDDFVINAPSEDKKAASDLDVKTVEPLKPSAKLVDLETSKTDDNKTSDLVDLEFDFEESFALDEDKIDVSAKKSDWSTDLADENFGSQTEPAIKIEVTPEPIVVAATTFEPIINDSISALEEEFPFLQTVDTFQTRLELARNYIALGETGSARELLAEVAEQGAAQQQIEARELISKLAS